MLTVRLSRFQLISLIKKEEKDVYRDIIEQVLRLHNNWMDSDAFTW